MGRRKVKRFVQVYLEDISKPGNILNSPVLDGEMLRLDTKDSFVAITIKDSDGVVWSYIYPEDKISLIKVREENATPKTLKVFEDEHDTEATQEN